MTVHLQTSDYRKFLRWRWIICWTLLIILLTSISLVAHRFVERKKNEQLKEFVHGYGGSIDFKNVAPSFTRMANRITEKIGLKNSGWGPQYHPTDIIFFDRIRTDFDFNDLGLTPVQLSFSGSPDISGEELSAILDFPSIRDIQIPINTLSDPHVAVLAKVANLDALNLDSTATTDAGIASLTRARRSLRQLTLNDCNLSDQSIPSLLELTNLQLISLKNTGITNAGLKKLITDHPSLRQITIDLNMADFESTSSLENLNAKIAVLIEP